MANAVYPLYKQSVMTETDTNNGLTGTGTSAVNTVLITTSSGYVYSAAHQFYSSLTNLVGSAVAVTTPAVTNGTFTADNATFTSVSGTVVGALVQYRQNTGANTTWRLVLYLDTSVTGLPVTPNGGNIVVTWNASGVFTLCDSNMKQDVRQVGKCGRAGLYEFAYRADPGRRHIGFMAQEVERFAPQAVRAISGVKYVDCGKAAALALAA
jgi:hypothetical protein